MPFNIYLYNPYKINPGCIEMKKKFNYIFILFLLCLSLIVQLRNINPPLLSDQLEYFHAASDFFDKPVEPNHRELRLGLIIPTAILIKIFGYSEAAYYFLPLVGMLLIVLGVYILAEKLFSQTVAFFSSLLIIFLPSLLNESGYLLPDIPALGLVMLSISFIIKAPDFEKRKNKTLGWLPYFLAGLLSGWAYLVREYIVILLGVIFCLFWLFNIPKKNLIYFALGFLLVFGLELVYSLRYYDDPFTRIESSLPRGTDGKITKDPFKIISYFPYLINKYSGPVYLGLLVICTVGLPVLSIRSKDNRKSFVFLFTWLILVYLFLTFVGLMPVIFSWEEKVLLRLHKFRYWIPILPAYVIGAAATIDYAIHAFQKKIIKSDKPGKYITAGVFLLISFSAILQSNQYMTANTDLVHYGSGHYLEFRDFMRENGSKWDLIWMDYDNNRAQNLVIPMYLRDSFGKSFWEGEIKYLDEGGEFIEPDLIQGGIIVVDQFYVGNDPEIYPDYMSKYPDNWELVFESRNKNIAVFEVQEK